MRTLCFVALLTNFLTIACSNDSPSSSGSGAVSTTTVSQMLAADTASQSAFLATSDAGDAAVASDIEGSSSASLFAMACPMRLKGDADRAQPDDPGHDDGNDIIAAIEAQIGGGIGASDPNDPNSVDDHSGIARQLACLGGMHGSATASQGSTSFWRRPTAAGAAALTADSNSVLTASYTGSLCTHGGQTRSGTDTIVAMGDQNGRHLYGIDCNSLVTKSNGDSTMVSSADANSPTYSFDANGTRAAGSVTLQVTVNAHHEHRAADGNVTASFVITTDPNNLLTITHLYDPNASTAAERSVPVSRVVNGTVEVESELPPLFSATVTFSAVTRDMTSDCSCPSSGSIAEAVSYADGTTFTRLYTLSACGAGTVAVSASNTASIPDGSASFAWSSCSS